MTNFPIVSIITPSMNHAAFIEEAIQSIITQNYPKIEYIVMDGGSTDGTIDILKKYSDKLIWHSEVDQSLYDAVNKGWELSKGEYLGYLNCDDLLCPGAVTTLVQYLSDNRNIPFVYGDFYRIDQRGNIIETYKAREPDLNALLRNGNFIFSGSMLFRRSLLGEIGWMDLSYKYSADYDFCVRIAKKFPMAHISQPIAMFRMHSDSKSQNSKWKMWQETVDISYRHSGKHYFSLHSRYWLDRLLHFIPKSILWKRSLVSLRKILRTLWNLGN